MDKRFYIILGVMALVTVMSSIMNYVSIKRSSTAKVELAKNKAQFDAWKDSTIMWKEQLRKADQVYWEEMGRLKEDVIELSKLREMSLRQIKILQDSLNAERRVRDSLGHTLLNW